MDSSLCQASRSSGVRVDCTGISGLLSLHRITVPGHDERLLGISKRGDAYVRGLLVHGARSALRTAPTKDDRLSQWVVRLSKRAHPNVACVALANKTARLAWALLRHHRDYQPALAAA